VSVPQKNRSPTDWAKWKNMPGANKQYLELCEAREKEMLANPEKFAEKPKIGPDGKRFSCKSGEKCYIFGRDHFKEEAHLGDPDFVPRSKEEKEADREKYEYFIKHQLIQLPASL
jgi:hypothetical protein